MKKYLFLTLFLILGSCYEGSLFSLYVTSPISSSVPVTPSFILVQGGTFQMGSNDSESDESEKPVHSVTVSSFNIGKYEVTQKEYQSVMRINPSTFKGDNLPVETVTWFEAITFCNSKSESEGLPVSYKISGENCNDYSYATNCSANLLDESGVLTTDVKNVKGYRLPTEAEWEYAAKGGSKSRGYIYSGSNSVDSVAWYSSNSGSKTHDVGTKNPNELGLYDMSGNVNEWCTDWYSSDYSSNALNPYSYRVVRGGDWPFIAKFSRSSHRKGQAPSMHLDNIGFRLAKTN